MTTVRHLAAELRVHGTLAGRGRAYAGDRLLAEVDYKLKDVEEVLGPTDRGAPEALPRVLPARTLYGYLKSPGDDTLGGHVGARLTLRLADGRALACTVVKQMNPGLFLTRALGDPQ